MAFYVRMTKIGEGPSAASYRFTDDDQRYGEASVNKADGTVSIVKPLAGASADAVSARAAARLRTAWRNRAATTPMPQIVEWAS